MTIRIPSRSLVKRAISCYSAGTEFNSNFLGAILQRIDAAYAIIPWSMQLSIRSTSASLPVLVMTSNGNLSSSEPHREYTHFSASIFIIARLFLPVRRFSHSRPRRI
jgi:hypothetical protein